MSEQIIEGVVEVQEESQTYTDESVDTAIEESETVNSADEHIDAPVEDSFEYTDEESFEAEEESDDEQVDIPEEEISEEQSATEESAASAELEGLRLEVEQLRGELEARRSESERLIADFCEFAELFPARDAKSIPKSVWESVRVGVPLAAAYALYEKKREAQERRAREINSQNEKFSTGALSGGGESGYFSAAEVKKMSPAEVRKNYNLIIESMKKWN